MLRLMVRNLIIIAMLLVGIFSYSQTEEKPFKSWAIEGELGAHSLIDASAYSDKFVHAGLLIRKNFNRTFGLGIRAGFDAMGLTSNTDIDSQLNYISLNLDAIVDVFDVVGLYSDWFTILAHGGPGVSFTDHRIAAQLGGGFTGIIKLDEGTAIKLGYAMHANINEPRTFDDQYIATTNGVSSIVNTFSIGLAIYLGDEDTHADFIPKECCGKGDVYYQGDTTIVNNNNIVRETIIGGEYVPIIQEFVFFDHDKSKVRKSELNAIYQMYNALDWHKANKVKIIGWASNTKSSAEYNLALSMRRCQAIKLKLMDMGVSEDRIIIDAEGKDYHLDKENVHDLARRVELIMIY